MQQIATEALKRGTSWGVETGDSMFKADLLVVTIICCGAHSFSESFYEFDPSKMPLEDFQACGAWTKCFPISTNRILP